MGAPWPWCWAILGLGYLLLSLFQSGPVEVGTVTVVSAGKEVTPLQNEIYVTQDGVVTEKRRLVPGEIGDSAPTVEVDHIVVRFEGRSQNGPFYFTIYDEDGLTYSEKKAESAPPPSPAPTWCARRPTGAWRRTTSAWSTISGSWWGKRTW